MPRNYYQCHCGWQITWAFTRERLEQKDQDVGLIIAQHVEKNHPEEIYGDVMPATVYRKWQRITTPKLVTV